MLSPRFVDFVWKMSRKCQDGLYTHAMRSCVAGPALRRRSFSASGTTSDAAPGLFLLLALGIGHGPVTYPVTYNVGQCPGVPPVRPIRGRLSAAPGATGKDDLFFTVAKYHQGSLDFVHRPRS
jgi:hypothetical protein